MLLPTLLNGAEREMINRRLGMITPHLVPADRRKIKEQVVQMMSGFGSASGDDDGAMATIAQFVKIMEGLPLFAIQRACMRWAAGDVKPDEVHEQSLRRGFPPSTAQLRIVAENIARPHRDEAATAHALLNAKKAPDPKDKSEDAKARVRAMHTDARRSLDGYTEAERQIAREEAERAEQRRIERGNTAIIEKYRAAGLDPVYLDDAKTMPVSLEMMLLNGHYIETLSDGKAVLVGPTSKYG